MKNYLVLLALAASFSISSCSKDDDEPAPVTNNYNTTNTTIPNPVSGIGQGSTDPAVIQFTKDMLTGTAWELTALVKGVDNTLNFADAYKNLPGCQRDDVYTFSANALTIADGLDWCGSAAQTKTGSWAMANSAKLTITASGVTQAGLTGEFTILQISETTLALQQKVNGFIYVATYQKHEPSPLENIVNKNWKVVASAGTINGQYYDFYSTYSPCEKDDPLNFDANGTLTYDNGPTKCSVSDPQTLTIPYNYSNNYLYFGQSNYAIVEATATKLVLNENTYSQGFSYNVTTTYTRQ